MSNELKKCGYIALIGRPNVGKSTLMNTFLNEKVSITSHKPQTTRHTVHGIKTSKNSQMIFVDTPGIHSKQKAKINFLMNRAAMRALSEVDVIVLLLEAMVLTNQDKEILQKLSDINKPLIIAINKVDQLENKNQLLPFITTVSEKCNTNAIIPISASKQIQLDLLEQEIIKYLPTTEQFFYDSTISTDKSKTFRAEELIREQIMRKFNQELPYSVSVQIQSTHYVKKTKLQRIHAIIWVERKAQKGIIIGEKGARLKQVGQYARQNLEQLYNTQVYLDLWVKVKSNWSDDTRSLHDFGIG